MLLSQNSPALLPENSVPTSVLGQTEIRIKGKDTFVPSAQIDGRTVISLGTWLKIASIQDEDLVEGELFQNPELFVQALKQTTLGTDIFTFAQKLPNLKPRFSYRFELENFAVIPITTFSDWWEKRVEASVRRAVRKSAKEGVVAKLAEFDEELIKGIVNINNETSVRQGRKFWHFGKSFEQVRKENSTYSQRNAFLGAYYQNQLIGYMRITFAGKVANIVQLLSMIHHYDKRPANALIAAAIKLCEKMGMSHLMYYNYIYNDPKSSLTEFKRRNGFEKVLLPRYYVPLTAKGRIALLFGLQRGLTQRIPRPVLTQILRIRSSWYLRNAKAGEGAA